MWRSYGWNGNGACIVFDTSKIAKVNGSPLLIGEVLYGSDQQRTEQIASYISQFCKIMVKNEIPTDKLGMATLYLFERIILFALFTKHSGFAEEQEWRIVYRPERDQNNSLTAMIDYEVGSRGIEPKLKLKVMEVAGAIGKGTTLSSLIDRIILGPSMSSPLATTMIEKMFDKISKPDLKFKLRASAIPFRPMTK